MEYTEIIGRDIYKSMLTNALKYYKASLVAMYGRRRVGKTYLVKCYLHDKMSFQYSGVHNVKSDIQLEN